MLRRNGNINQRKHVVFVFTRAEGAWVQCLLSKMCADTFLKLWCSMINSDLNIVRKNRNVFGDINMQNKKIEASGNSSKAIFKVLEG